MRSLILTSLLMLAGNAHAADAAGDVAALNKLYAEFWEENLKRNPITATFAGDPRYNGELHNFLSKEFEDGTREFHSRYLRAAKAIGPGR
jgi:hypothetical protein